MCLLTCILVALDKISTRQSSEARKAALSLKNSITRSEFVVSLVILENISGLILLGPTFSASEVTTVWRYRNSIIIIIIIIIIIVQATNDIGDMISTLQRLRTHDGFHKLFQQASNVVETFLDCNTTKPRTASRSVIELQPLPQLETPLRTSTG